MNVKSIEKEGSKAKVIVEVEAEVILEHDGIHVNKAVVGEVALGCRQGFLLGVALGGLFLLFAAGHCH